MLLAPRKLAFLLLAGLALAVAGCGSNNKGKIVGKWKVTDPSDKDPKAKDGFQKLGQMGIYMYMEFKDDSTAVMGFDADKPGMIELLKMGIPGGKVTFPAKYKLMSGNKVEIYDFSAEAKQILSGKGERMRSDIIIEGDNMTIKDADGTITKLVKITDKAPPATGPVVPDVTDPAKADPNKKPD